MNETTRDLVQATLESLLRDWRDFQKEEADHTARTVRLDTKRTQLSQRIGDLRETLREEGNENA